MEIPVTMNMAQKYAVSRDNPEEVFQFFLKNFGCARKVYNLSVDNYYKHLEAAGYTSGDKIPKVASLKASELKKEYPYLKEADSLGIANSLMDFSEAVRRFRGQGSHREYTKRALRRDRSGTEPLSFRGLKGIPKFHAKALGDFSYRTTAQYPVGKNGVRPTIRLEGDILYLPKLKGGVRILLHRDFPKDARIGSVTVSMDTDGTFYVSIGYTRDIRVEMSLQQAAMDGTGMPEGLAFLGLDYSQSDFYVDNEGRKANYPKYYRQSEERLARLQKSLARKEKDSLAYKKVLGQIQKLNTKIRNQRKDFLQKESTLLVSEYDAIVVEDIDLRGMGGALTLGKNLYDNGFGMFRQMLSYKLRRKGSCLVKIDRWYPSSKTCCRCGNVLETLDLKTRTYQCPHCGMVMDRDWNAAANICAEGMRIFPEYLRSVVEAEQEAALKAAANRQRRRCRKAS